MILFVFITFFPDTPFSSIRETHSESIHSMSDLDDPFLIQRFASFVACWGKTPTTHHRMYRRRLGLTRGAQTVTR
jgi:hypothetical protein